MNKKLKTILSLAGFALFIGLAVFAYNRLGRNVRPAETLNVIGESASAAPAMQTSEEPAAEESASPQPEQTPQPETTVVLPKTAETDQPEAEASALPQESAAAATAEPERMKAPDFTVQDMDGKEVKLSDFIGRPVVINFWASWCPPCKYEMPEFEKVYQELGGDVAFLMIDLVDGQRETKEKGAEYVQSQGFTFPVYYDFGEAATAYGVRSIPTTYFIDAGGYLIAGAQTAIDAETLHKGIALINK